MMQKTLKREIFRAIIKQIPVMSYFEETIWNALFRKYNEKYSIIHRELDEYCSALYNSVGLDNSNPGSAKSAAFDVVQIFNRVKITPDLLIDIKFSEDELERYLINSGEDIINTASSIRQGLILEGLHRIAKIVILSTVDNPEYKAKFYNHILSKL